MTASDAEQSWHAGLDGPALLDALLADKRVEPIHSVDDLTCEDVFGSDEELDGFLDWVAAERKANLA